MGKGGDKEGIVLGVGKEGEEFRLPGGGGLGEGLNSFGTSISAPCCC
jgi:hypothetical protein